MMMNNVYHLEVERQAQPGEYIRSLIDIGTEIQQGGIYRVDSFCNGTREAYVMGYVGLLPHEYVVLEVKHEVKEAIDHLIQIAEKQEDLLKHITLESVAQDIRKIRSHQAAVKELLVQLQKEMKLV